MLRDDVILITGAGGFLGSRLLPRLRQRVPEARIIAVSRKKIRPFAEKGKKISFLFGDLRDPELWEKLPVTITQVFHLAAVIPWEQKLKQKAKIVSDNLLPLAHLIEYSNKWKRLRQVVYSSSISVYPQSLSRLDENSVCEPVDIYGAVKLAGEYLLLCLQARGVRIVSLRYSSLYGCGQYQGTVLPVMIRDATGKKRITVYGNGSRTQDFLECSDAADAAILAYTSDADGVFNVGSGIPVSMLSLAGMVNKIFAFNSAKVVRAQEDEVSPGYKINIDKARRILGYKPRFPIEAGLNKLKREMRR
jgi:UDP-glucose 4-epimerase